MAVRLWIVACCFFGASAILASAARLERVPARESFATFPMRIAGWQGERQPDFDAAILRELGTDDYVNAVFREQSKDVVGLYVGYYASQRQGGAIHSPANCLPGAGWQPTEAGRLTIAGLSAGPPSREPVEVNRWIIQKGDERQLVLYWYQSHGRVVASEYASKIRLVLDSMRMHRSDAALVRVIAPIDEGSSGARTAAEQSAVSFIRSVFPVLDRYLPV